MNKTVCINALDEKADQPPVQNTHRSIVLDYDSDERDLDSVLFQMVVYEIRDGVIQSRYAYDHELPESYKMLLDQIAKGWYTVYMVDSGVVTVYLPFELINKPHLFTDYFEDAEGTEDE